MQVILMNNPFPYSLDNKRYQTWNYYLQTLFKMVYLKSICKWQKGGVRLWITLGIV